MAVLVRTDRRGRVLAAEGAGTPTLAIAPGGTLAPLVAEPGAAQLFDVLLGLRRSGAALAWEVPAAPSIGAAALHFAALAAGDAAWIAVAREREDLLAWCRRVVAEGARDLDPRPAPAVLERLGALLPALAPQAPAADAAALAAAVERLERLVAEKDREIAELTARLEGG